MKHKKLSIYNMSLISILTAVTCIIAPFSISIPISPVPISFIMIALFLSIYIIGYQLAFISYLIYLLLGIIGLPVFTGFSGGVAKLLGPTGGYLIGFLFLIIISGLFINTFKVTPKTMKTKKIAYYSMHFLGMIIGTAITYTFGTIWLAHQTNMSLYAALWAGVIPYIPGDIIKIIISILLGPKIRNSVDKTTRNTLH